MWLNLLWASAIPDDMVGVWSVFFKGNVLDMIETVIVMEFIFLPTLVRKEKCVCRNSDKLHYDADRFDFPRTSCVRDLQNYSVKKGRKLVWLC